ncbi:choice-of-anchor K domain-containing protein [Baaleninema simplex]|uniref:choice-of-anchor K domain-containing protein n=1 Tax=Baaleninema simplex TaxID=2862350 RepID=UPI00034CAB3C|nr:choice-of-anchor K domain-containing protein [Baaleninema simplex]
MATATTSGTWIGAIGVKGTPDVTDLTGLNTNQISWGKPSKGNNPTKDFNPDLKQSSYVFEGSKSTNIPLDGTDFELGTFHHLNYTITGDNNLAKATLHVEVTIAKNPIKGQFNLQFEHDETPNDPDTNIGPDLVAIPKIDVVGTLKIDDKEYKVVIQGFLNTATKARQTKFTTKEGEDNEAIIIAKLVEVPVPPPKTKKPKPENKVCYYLVPVCPPAYPYPPVQPYPPAYPYPPTPCYPPAYSPYPPAQQYPPPHYCSCPPPAKQYPPSCYSYPPAYPCPPAYPRSCC